MDDVKFQAGLGRLHMCGNRIFQAHFALERTKLDILALEGLIKINFDIDEINKFQTEIIVKTNSLIERIIINCENIFEIHNELKDLLLKKYPELCNELDVLWQEIYEIKSLTGNWRNNVTAHGKFMGKEPRVTFPSDLGSVKDNLQRIMYTSVLIITYVKLTLANVSEYEESWKELSTKSSQAENDNNVGIDYVDYHKSRVEAEKKIDSFLTKFKESEFKLDIEYE